MSYRYLLDLYEVLDQRARTIQETDEPEAVADASYREGRLDCLHSFKSFLQQHYHSQLPRRIRTRLSTK